MSYVLVRDGFRDRWITKFPPALRICRLADRYIYTAFAAISSGDATGEWIREVFALLLYRTRLLLLIVWRPWLARHVAKCYGESAWTSFGADLYDSLRSIGIIIEEFTMAKSFVFQVVAARRPPAETRRIAGRIHLFSEQDGVGLNEPPTRR